MLNKAIEKHDYLMNQLLKNHSETYNKYFHEVILRLQNLYKDREIYSQQLEENINDRSWLLKRLGKKILPKD